MPLVSVRPNVRCLSLLIVIVRTKCLNLRRQWEVHNCAGHLKNFLLFNLVESLDLDQCVEVFYASRRYHLCLDVKDVAHTSLDLLFETKHDTIPVRCCQVLIDGHSRQLGSLIASLESLIHCDDSTFVPMHNFAMIILLRHAYIRGIVQWTRLLFSCKLEVGRV